MVTAMSPLKELVNRHVNAMLIEAAGQQLPTDVLGRELLAMSSAYTA